MRTFYFVLFTFISSFTVLSGQSLKPYIVGFATDASIETVKTSLKAKLQTKGMEVIGEYQPASDDNRYILIFTSSELKQAVSKIGGLTGFAAALRIGITRENGKTLVSYTDPLYWGNAYFRNDFDKVSSLYAELAKKLQSLMETEPGFKGYSFGSKNGMEAKDLRKYHYMLGMPYFDNTVKLGTFDSYTAARRTIAGNLSKGTPNVKLVYSVEIPDKNLCLYGLKLSGPEGEAQFLPVIDIANPKHTAFLPYEILVVNNEVHMLHGRFRIALSFPDLTMGTFTKIMSTPGNIEDLLDQLTN